MELFRFDRAKASASIEDPDGALWPVNAFSDADELNALMEAALESGPIATARPRTHIYVYPLSVCEPEPLLAVDPGAGPTLLGCSLKLREREGESPVEFTLRLLEEMVAAADALAACSEADRPVDAGRPAGKDAGLTAELTDRIRLVLDNDEALCRRREIVRRHLAAQADCPTCGGSGEGPIASEQDCDRCKGKGFLKRPPDRLAEDLRDWCEELIGPGGGDPLSPLARDLLALALARVDWTELAEDASRGSPSPEGRRAS